MAFEIQCVDYKGRIKSEITWNGEERAVKTVIVSPEAIGPHKNGGIGTFATNLGILLRTHGHDVTIMYTGDILVPREEWISLYETNQIEFVVTKDDSTTYRQDNLEPFALHAEIVTAKMPDDADIVYFQDWQADGYHFLRSRQFKQMAGPVCISVIHSSHQWALEASELFPKSLRSMQEAYLERYQVAHSDFAVSPSQYMLNYVNDTGWDMPPRERQRVLGYPFFLPRIRTEAPLHPAVRFKRLVYFGRIETRKGIELFVDALAYLNKSQPETLAEIDEIVLMGREAWHRFSSLGQLEAAIKTALKSASVNMLTDLSSLEAQRYLADHVADSLVVAPSLLDNYPFAVIEASLIPGLNLICSSSGGQPEILGDHAESQFFEPEPRSLAHKLQQWLAHGPVPDKQLAHYPWDKFNLKWLQFHDEVCEFAASRKRVPERGAQEVTEQQNKSVDVCVPYVNDASSLLGLLKSLDDQTTDNFNLYVVSDDSDDPLSMETFEEARQLYANHVNWHFVCKDQTTGRYDTNNFAASLGDAEYLCFVDSNNVAMPNMIERFVTCMRNSKSDCLACSVYWFEGDTPPKLSDPADVISKRLILQSPVGGCKELGLFYDAYGDTNFIVRREVFNSLGGFAIAQRAESLAAGEDREFLAKVVMKGLKYDAIPEALLFCRVGRGGTSATSSDYHSQMRRLSVFRRELQKIGLQFLVPWVYQLYLDAQLAGEYKHSAEEWEKVASDRQARLDALAPLIDSVYEQNQLAGEYKHSAEEWEKVASDRQARLDALAPLLERRSGRLGRLVDSTRVLVRTAVKPVYNLLLPVSMRDKIWEIRHGKS